MTPAVLVMFWFIFKHFIADFMMQPAFMHQNKGTYGHYGGIVHAGFHSVWTAFGLLAFMATGLLDISETTITLIVLAEFVVHYHIDWAKMNINKKMGWGANTHAEFWYLTGFDQFLHMLTYVIILEIVI